MIRRVSYLTCLIVLSVAVAFADPIKEFIKGLPVVGDLFNKK